MPVTAQTDAEKAGISNVQQVFTTVGGVKIHMTKIGSRWIGMGPGDPDNDLILDTATPYGAGSIFISTDDGAVNIKGVTDSSDWTEVTSS